MINLMDLVFENDQEPQHGVANSLFDLIDDDIVDRTKDYSFCTSESVNPDDALFTEIQPLDIIED